MMKDNLPNETDIGALVLSILILTLIALVGAYTSNYKETPTPIPIVKTKVELDDELLSQSLHTAKDQYNNCYWWTDINYVHLIECSKIGR